jgi:hypothetical protein
LPGPFTQRRLNTWFRKGPAFYAEYNFRLFFFLCVYISQADLFCRIESRDTIIPSGLSDGQGRHEAQASARIWKHLKMKLLRLRVQQKEIIKLRKFS